MQNDNTPEADEKTMKVEVTVVKKELATGDTTAEQFTITQKWQADPWKVLTHVIHAMGLSDMQEEVRLGLHDSFGLAFGYMYILKNQLSNARFQIVMQAIDWGVSFVYDEEANQICNEDEKTDGSDSSLT